jgi:hypothetical protein
MVIASQLVSRKEWQKHHTFVAHPTSHFRRPCVTGYARIGGMGPTHVVYVTSGLRYSNACLLAGVIVLRVLVV